ncbi:MAG: hypothetical protein EA400_00285 [Chromatiaceae bacterium]|nr:MAG: hypothetical protein EA400_00285 [Chromatiaceae bacterium]
MDEFSDLELLDALGIEITPEQQAARTPREERIIAGFEEIQRFYEEHGRGPLHGEDHDIFERVTVHGLMSQQQRTLLGLDSEARTGYCRDHAPDHGHDPRPALRA